MPETEGVDYGLSFHIDMRLSQAVRTHFIKAALVAKSGEAPILNSFQYEIPETIPHGPRRLGASETLGIFGGVKDSAQRTLSEIVERNIGDVVTLVMMQFLLRQGKQLSDGRRRRLLILGPPIPKVLGRLASLRMPRALGVGWFYSFPPPEWLSSFPGWSIVSRAGHHLSRLWMEDELVIEDYKAVDGVEYRLAWMNQYVNYENVYSQEWMADVVHDLNPTPWVDSSVRLPSVLSLAALYALAERGRSYKGYLRKPSSMLASASLEGESDLASEHMEERIRQIEEMVNRREDMPSFHDAMRGDSFLSVAALPELAKLWTEIKASGKASMIS